MTLVLAMLIALIAIANLPRLLEFNLREMKIVLAELKKTKAEIETMYGVIDHLKREPVAMDKVKYEELGLFGGGITGAHSVVNYVMGCMKRERERFARIFVNEKSPDQLAAAILDASLDPKVFKWIGPRALLDDPAPLPPQPPQPAPGS